MIRLRAGREEGTTDYTDDTDEEGRKREKVGRRSADSDSRNFSFVLCLHPCYPCNPWFGLLLPPLTTSASVVVLMGSG
jgi:hypothetical protein